ncbi:hypothetical protein ABBQ32_012805 [Trebouxia sp. C0010 RCD-2024]
MSRLCCSDPKLFALYEHGKLKTDVRLKSSHDCSDLPEHPVSSDLLQTYTTQLADIIKQTTDEIVLVDTSPEALRLFTEAMYGKSLKDACSNKYRYLREAVALGFFGHEYEVEEMQPALCEILANPEKVSVAQLDWPLLIACYRDIPQGLHYLQDALFQVLFASFVAGIGAVQSTETIAGYVANHENFSSPKTELAKLIKPRHVNLWLCHMNGTATAGYGYSMRSQPSIRAGQIRIALELTATAQYQSQDVSDLWVQKVVVPIFAVESDDPEMKDEIDAWVTFRNSLKPC